MLHKAIIRMSLGAPAASGTNRRSSRIRRFVAWITGHRDTLVFESFLWPVLLGELAEFLGKMKIERIIKLSADGIESFSRSSGGGPVREVVEAFVAGGSDLYFESVGTVKMLAETDAGSFHHLLEIAIRRRHAPGEAPVVIVVNSLDEDPGTSAVQEKESFRQFVDRLELTARKQLPVAAIAVDYTGRLTVDGGHVDTGSGEYVDDFDLVGEGASGDAAAAALFPLHGVTLGVTTERELAERGRHSTGTDDQGKVFAFYVITGMNFWYENGIANAIYLTYADPLPNQWRALGFAWELSYNEWLALFRKRGCDVQVVTPPGAIKHFQGTRMTFAAEIVVIWREEGREYPLRFVFNYGQGTGEKDRNTLYSFGIRLT